MVEVKYLTRGWAGTVGDERFGLRNHGAQDIRAYDVVNDINRVERFIAGRPGADGAVIVLTPACGSHLRSPERASMPTTMWCYGSCGPSGESGLWVRGSQLLAPPRR